MDYEKLHKDTITKLQEMVNSGKITVEIAREICADFVPESEDEKIRKALIEAIRNNYTLTGYINHIPTKDILAWLEKQGEKDLVTCPICGWEIKKQGEQKPTIEMKTTEESLGIDSDTYNKIVDECVYGEQNPAWSEEDEENLSSAIYYIRREPYRECDVEPIVDWLRNKLSSLKPQSTWKPSDEQIKGIECAIKTLKYQLNAGDKRLNSLYNDLKKLMEE